MGKEEHLVAEMGKIYSYNVTSFVHIAEGLVVLLRELISYSPEATINIRMLFALLLCSVCRFVPQATIKKNISSICLFSSSWGKMKHSWVGIMRKPYFPAHCPLVMIFLSKPKYGNIAITGSWDHKPIFLYTIDDEETPSCESHFVHMQVHMLEEFVFTSK